MPDLEKVIKGLKCISGDVVWCAYCPYSSSDGSGRGERCKREAAKDALALLKAQEPRVMTLEEILSINGGDIVWIEDRSLDEMIAGIKFQSPSKNCYYVMLIGSKRPQTFSKELYEVNWRCWTSRPTDEQREATPW